MGFFSLCGNAKAKLSELFEVFTGAAGLSSVGCLLNICPSYLSQYAYLAAVIPIAATDARDCTSTSTALCTIAEALAGSEKTDPESPPPRGLRSVRIYPCELVTSLIHAPGRAYIQMIFL